MTSRGDFIGIPKPVTTSPSNNHRIFPPFIEQEDKHTMSISQWCDVDDPTMNYHDLTGHPFSSNDPNKHHFADTQMVDVATGNSYGRTTYQQQEEVTETFDMCGYHWERRNPFSVKRPELPSGPSSSSVKTLDELMAEDDNYRRGYEAAIDRVLSENESNAP